MKYDLRISVKDYRRGKNLKIQLAQLSFSSSRQFFVKMNASPWPGLAPPVLVGSLSGRTLMLSWSDPTFSLQQSPGLAPSAWVTLSSNSPAVFTIGIPGNMFYRLKK
jgi:hypothetical protein